MRGVFHDDDGIIHHDADSQNQGEQSHQIDRETQHGHGREGPDDGYRYRGGRHQRGAPVLQEDHHHRQYQQAGLVQRLVDGIDRLLDELGRVVADGEGQSLGKLPGPPFHFLPNLLAHLDGVGARQGIHQDLGGLAPGEAGEVAVRLLAKLHTGDIADANDLGRLTGLGWYRLDDNVLELRHIVQPAQRVYGQLKGLILGHRGAAQLTGNHLGVLLPDSVGHIHRGKAEILQPLRIQPDAHAVGTRAQHLHLTHAGNTPQRILQIDQGVVGQKGLVVAIIVGIQTDRLQDVGGHLADTDALLLHGVRQLRQLSVDQILHQTQRRIQIRADPEGDGQHVGAIRAAGRGHVQRILHAVDPLLDGNPDGLGDDFGAGPGIARNHLDGRRNDIGILRDRQVQQAD